MARRAQVLLQVFTELESGVVGGDVDAHIHSLGTTTDRVGAGG
jgi:hypothetical protein